MRLGFFLLEGGTAGITLTLKTRVVSTYGFIQMHSQTIAQPAVLTPECSQDL